MLIWGDSFDHYGLTESNMLAGEWAAFTIAAGASIDISTDFARTGTHSLKFTSANTGNPTLARRALGGSPRITCGIGGGVYQTSLPGTNAALGCQFRNISNVAILTAVFQSDGSICIRKGDETAAVVDISDAVLTAGTFHHVEIWATFDTVAGAVEVRVNGRTVLMLGGLNLGSVGAAQVVWGMFTTRDSGDWYLDDTFAADDSGTYNNTFLGAQRILTEFPTADTAQADWSKNGAATGFGCIDQADPDGDTTYISAATAGDKSDFTLPSLPSELAEIAGVYVPLMARINAAGIGNIKPSMLSSTDVLAGNDDPLTTGYTYYGSVFEYDPHTNAAWTKAGLEAAKLRIEKSL
jgi:hypothetical protein